jgi:hypothetical protein
LKGVKLIIMHEQIIMFFSIHCVSVNRFLLDIYQHDARVSCEYLTNIANYILHIFSLEIVGRYDTNSSRSMRTNL